MLLNFIISISQRLWIVNSIFFMLPANKTLNLRRIRMYI